MRSVLVLLINSYRWVLSPLFPGCCRFYPSCSEYAAMAVERFGVRRGLWLALGRILRCHPWHVGGYDPVPESPGNLHGERAG